MANKNTRQLRNRIRTACKAKQATVERNQPVGNYHSQTGSWPTAFHTKQTFPTAVPDKRGVVSSAPRRNMAMRVLTNQGEDGKRQSLTVHEPIRKDEYVTYKGHKYLREDKSQNGSNHYKQPRAETSRPTAV